MPEAPKRTLAQLLLNLLFVSVAVAVVASWLRDIYAYKIANVVIGATGAILMWQAIKVTRSRAEFNWLGWKRIYRDTDPILWVATLGALWLVMLFLGWMGISYLLSFA